MYWQRFEPKISNLDSSPRQTCYHWSSDHWQFECNLAYLSFSLFSFLKDRFLTATGPLRSFLMRLQWTVNSISQVWCQVFAHFLSTWLLNPSAVDTFLRLATIYFVLHWSNFLSCFKAKICQVLPIAVWVSSCWYIDTYLCLSNCYLWCFS